MKHLILITLILSSSLWAAERSSNNKPIKKNEVKGGIVINESLQKLMDIDGVKPIYEKCKTAANDTNGILECLWVGVKQNEDLKKKVQAAYTQELKEKPTDATPATGRAPASESKPKTNMTGRNASVGIDYESDPAVAALSKYFGDKLDAILNPEAEDSKKGVILTTNHRLFIDLYKSELGKTIINAFTSYCLDTDPASCGCSDAELKVCAADKAKCSCSNNSCTISDEASDRKTHRTENLEKLKTADLSSDGPDSIKWKMCITSVPKACKEAKTSSTTISQSETIKRSCLIMDYVESARKNIIAADAQKEFYDDLSKTQTYKIENLAKDADPKKSSSDAILEMSSSDVTKALKDPLAKDTQEFETCFKDDQVVNAKACEKYLNVNAKDNEMAIAELGMRQIAQEGALEDELDSSSNKVIDYLKEEGFSKEQITDMTSDPAKIETVKKEIMDRYRSQKAAIIAEMAAKIQSKTTSGEGKVDNITDKSKLQNIRDELAKRSTDLSGLVKFNNIVSSYLEVSREGSKVNDRNTASLFGEINDMTEADRKVAQEQVKRANLEENKNSNGQSQTNLDVKTINNEFLNYSTQTKPKDKKD